MTQALLSIAQEMAKITTTSPLLAVLLTILCLAVLVFSGAGAALAIVSVSAVLRTRAGRKNLVESAVMNTHGAVAVLAHDVADMQGKLLTVLEHQQQAPAPAPAHAPGAVAGAPRFFYLGYVIVIDHDRNAEEFGIPGLEIIKRGTVTRPGMMVMVSGDGVFNPAVVRLFLMRRFADANMLPNGLPADTIIEHFRGPAAPDVSIGSDGEVTYGDVLDVVINCIHELTELEFGAHCRFIEQMRIHGSNNNRNNE